MVRTLALGVVGSWLACSACSGAPTGDAPDYVIESDSGGSRRAGEDPAKDGALREETPAEARDEEPTITSEEDEPIEPGPLAEGAPCTGDADCQSTWCGCNGTNVHRCLASKTLPKNCAGAGGLPGPGANWTACAVDGDCESNWCGCNGGSEKVCLPDPRYSKPCS
jgi:hypothetical protein